MDNQRFKFDPSLGWDESKNETTVSFKIWDNKSGNEIFNLMLPNPPERMKTIDFYESKEWEGMRPELEEGCYHILSLFI